MRIDIGRPSQAFPVTPPGIRVPYHGGPAIYFYDTEGNPIAAESVVDITGDLEITEDGALTVQTEMEPLGVLTISTHGRGELVSGSARVVSDGPIGGMLRFEHPDLGVAGVGASPPLSDALFPVRRQEGGINTGVALHNLESSPGLVRCDLMREPRWWARCSCGMRPGCGDQRSGAGRAASHLRPAHLVRVNAGQRLARLSPARRGEPRPGRAATGHLPRALAAELTGHEVSTVQAAGWSGTTNGELLRRAQGSFDILLSMDRGLQHQQDLGALRLRIVVIRAPSNRHGLSEAACGQHSETLWHRCHLDSGARSAVDSTPLVRRH